MNILYKGFFCALSVQNSQFGSLRMDIIWSRLLQAQEIKNPNETADKKKKREKRGGRKILLVLIS